MKNVLATAGVMTGCLVLIGANGLMGQDWPQWRGPNRDARVADFTAPAAWPKELTKKWTVAVGEGDSTPALVGDKLFVFGRDGGDEVIACLDAATGKEQWKDKYPANAPGRPADSHPGPRSSPAVADGKVCTLGVDGTVSCLDAAKGTIIWRKKSADEGYAGLPRFYTSLSPLIVDGLCIVHLGGGDKGALIAYDLAKGDAKWKWDGDTPAYSSPVVLTVEGTKMIVTMTDKNVVGVGAADGKLLWKIPFAPQGMAYNAPTPLVDGDTVIFTGQGRGTKAVKVAKDGDGFKTTELWSIPELATQFNTPVLTKDGLLFGLSAGAGRGGMGGGRGGGMGGGRGGGGSYFCINAKTGKAAWTDATNRGTTYGAIVDTGSVLFALTSKSELSVLQPTEKAYTELATYKVSDKQTFSYPVLSGKRLFIRDQDSVTLWMIE